MFQRTCVISSANQRHGICAGIDYFLRCGDVPESIGGEDEPRAWLDFRQGNFDNFGASGVAERLVLIDHSMIADAASRRQAGSSFSICIAVQDSMNPTGFGDKAASFQNPF